MLDSWKHIINTMRQLCRFYKRYDNIVTYSFPMNKLIYNEINLSFIDTYGYYYKE